MNRLTKFSMKNVSALFIIMFILFGSGIYSANKLKVENNPDVTFPVVMVSTTYTGSPKDVMELITSKQEDKLANLEDLDSMSSTSSDTGSRITLEFKFGVDIDKKKQDVESALQEVSLPDGAGTPKASTFGIASTATNDLVVYAKDGLSQSDLDKLYKDTIKPGIESLAGIDHFDVVGARDTSLDIEMNADALSVYGLTPTSVKNAINTAISKNSIGTVEISGGDKIARVTGDIQSLYDLGQIEITTSSAGIITLSQVAEIKAINESDFNGRLDGKPAIGLILYKASSANAVEFSKAINSLIEGWKTTMPNVAFKSTYDSAIDIEKSLNGLIREGVVGALLAALMILLFLRNVRMTLIVLVSIPLSILITLMLMKSLGLTLNTMTLGGIFISVGRVVDDSIVVIENIYTSLEKAQKRNESVILLATQQVAMAITSSTIATVAVFVPMGMLSGIIGQFFRPFSITIICALLSSLIVALTVIPMLAKLLVLRGKPAKSHGEEGSGPLESFYSRVLQWCLHHRLITLLITIVLFVGTLASTIPNLKMSFLPNSSPSKTMYFQLKLPKQTSFDATNEKTQEIENALRETKDSNGQPVFMFVEALVGFAGDDSVRTAYASQIYVEVNDKVDPDTVKAQVKTYILSELPQGSEVDPKSIGGGFGVSTTDFQYSLQGDDQVALEAAAAVVKKKLEEFPELREIEDSLSDGSTEIEIAVDQKKARAYGLSATSVKETAQTWIQKQKLGDIKFDNVNYTTTVSMQKSDKNSIEKLGNIPLTSTSGSTVLLKEVAKIQEKESATSLSRDDQKQVVSVTAKINSEDKTGVTVKITTALKQLELPSGVTTALKGSNKDMNESFQALGIAMVIAVALIYLVMVLAFGNAGAPFAVMFSLPLAALGGLIGLVITGQSLNVTSMIGFMMLIGIVVTNAIVLIDRAQQLREQGYTVRQALLEAGRVRLRPIIMTAGATIVALLPLALGLSGGEGLIGPALGVTVIGGLTTSTVLTLVVVPIIYELLEGLKKRVARLFNRTNKNETTAVEV